MEIRQYSFNNIGRQEVLEHPMGKDWPVVYLIHNNDKLYIGETNNLFMRFGQHLENRERKNLTNIKVIYDDEFNKSAILDIEQSLIRLFSADKKYELQNANLGQSSKHNYYQREKYLNKIEGSDQEKGIWACLGDMGMTNGDYTSIINSDLFRYSPYTSLTQEQETICYGVVNDLIDGLENHKYRGTSCIVDGAAGTGKTIVGIYLMALLMNANAKEIDAAVEEDADMSSEKFNALHKLRKYIEKHNELKVAYVLPMTSIRKTIKTVFKLSKNGLKANMVVGPTDIADEKYDIIIVDEAHRLSKRKNIGWMGSFDKVCRKLHMVPETSNCLDWIVAQSRCRVLFYDSKQRVRGSDITPYEMQRSLDNSTMISYHLTTQMRCAAGSDFVDYLERIFACKQEDKISFGNYDLKMFVDGNEMIDGIKKKNARLGLCRVVAGDSWEWKTKGLTKAQAEAKGIYDIDIDGKHYVWNRTNCEWILRKESVEEIGCIHTTQGYDLNYVGVILGREIDFDPVSKEVIVNKDLFFDKNAKIGNTDEEIKTYVLNAYKVMMTRGIKGCYVYAYNKNLREYLQRFFDVI